MNKIEKAILVVIVMVFAVIVINGFLIYESINDGKLGSLNVSENAYTSDVVYTSSTISGNTLFLSRATSSRTFGRICQKDSSINTVWLFKATTTGMQVNMGSPIYPSSSPAGKTCEIYDINDPFLGAVYGTSSGAASVSIEVLQN